MRAVLCDGLVGCIVPDRAFAQIRLGHCVSTPRIFFIRDCSPRVWRISRRRWIGNNMAGIQAEARLGEAVASGRTLLPTLSIFILTPISLCYTPCSLSSGKRTMAAFHGSRFRQLDGGMAGYRGQYNHISCI